MRWLNHRALCSAAAACVPLRRSAVAADGASAFDVEGARYHAAPAWAELAPIDVASQARRRINRRQKLRLPQPRARQWILRRILSLLQCLREWNRLNSHDFARLIRMWRRVCVRRADGSPSRRFQLHRTDLGQCGRLLRRIVVLSLPVVRLLLELCQAACRRCPARSCGPISACSTTHRTWRRMARRRSAWRCWSVTSRA